MYIFLFELGKHTDESKSSNSIDNKRDDLETVVGLLADGHADGVQTEQKHEGR